MLYLYSEFCGFRYGIIGFIIGKRHEKFFSKRRVSISLRTTATVTYVSLYFPLHTIERCRHGVPRLQHLRRRGLVFYIQGWNMEIIPHSDNSTMFNFLYLLLKSIFNIVFKQRKNVILIMLLLKKENQIYKRQLKLQNKRLIFRRSDRFSLSMLRRLSKRMVNHLTIVNPDTLLSWQRQFIKNFYTCKHKPPGRKPISREIKSRLDPGVNF